MAGRDKKLSLHPLSFEEALGDLMKVKPPAKVKTNRKRQRRSKKQKATGGG